jgi:hypothetical protein
MGCTLCEKSLNLSRANQPHVWAPTVHIFNRCLQQLVFCKSPPHSPSSVTLEYFHVLTTAHEAM